MTNLVREKRLELNLTMRKVSEATGIAPSFIHYIEMGTKVPSVYHAMRLAKVLEISVEELFPINEEK